MLKTKVKTYPNRVFQDAIRSEGVLLQALWQIKGPKDTGIDWITCYYIAPLTVIHFSYADGGWDIHTGSEHIERDATINEVLERVKRFRQEQAA